MTENKGSATTWIQRFALEKPIWTGLVLLAIAFFFKWVDTWEE